MHPAAYAYVAECTYRLGVDELDKAYVIDLGGAHRNPGAPHVRTLFADAKLYTVVDIADELGVDHVADVTAPLPWPGFAFDPAESYRYDVAVCCEVFEHVAGWRCILDNAAALLRPGGVLIVTCAGTGRAPHGATDTARLRAGEWYENVTGAELTAALTRSTAEWPVWAGVEVREHPERGDTYATARRANP